MIAVLIDVCQLTRLISQFELAVAAWCVVLVVRMM